VSSIAFLFPGQGAQQVGMGQDFCAAFPASRRVFDLAEQAAGLPLQRICFSGPEEDLARTDVCQVAIFTVSAAILAAMNEALGAEKFARLQPAYMAGLSLGEYTALYAADAVDLAPAIALVRRRGQLMQHAATAVPSGMVALIGLDEPKARELCEAASQGQTLVCANFNCPGQIVISGQIEACKRAESLARDFGASNAVLLKVAGAFHSDIMQPAAQELGKTLQTTVFRQPQTPVISNVDGQPYASPDQVAPKLLAQLVSPVRWQQSMEFLLAQGVERFYEIGPGRTLAGMMRRIHRKAEVVSLNSAQALEKLASQL